jgi:hypothetical protein
MGVELKAMHELEHQQLGAGSIVFMALAAVAPMGAAVGAMPLAIALGDDIRDTTSRGSGLALWNSAMQPSTSATP